ncbi:alpha/beta hydrolase family protein [Aquimarina sp. 2201CG14-23]|uniref:alpha/beta hydrolase family protein n=1 Tax=Aquimarina mycalae TaxID=3040073 RepID=UPI002477F456|nr:prolyl oligopeptidase family serine peptidase [Aquimarina sp. 2201CG14-23]MDH7445254.1 prolyl oligopeptidase family serine peptidase [Aquimarina sp. 2201CG14-23]
MKHFLVIIFIVINLFSCTSQESIIIKKKEINWQEFPDLFTDNKKTTFIDKFHFLENVTMYEITYLSDGLKIQSFAAIPKKEGKYPVIIYNRGGNRDFGAIQLFGGHQKLPIAHIFSKLANEGYIVIGCNYRGSGNSEGMEEFGGKDVNDILNLNKVVHELPKADTKRIGMYGWSRGGMMTYIALTKMNNIKAAVVGGARSDLRTIDRPQMEKRVYAELIPDYYQNKDEELKKRSAILWADKFSPNVPILLLHGNSDWRVKSTNSLRLALEFEKHRIPYRLKIFEGANHGISQFRKERDQDVLDWFNKYLKGSATLPNMEFHGR